LNRLNLRLTLAVRTQAEVAPLYAAVKQTVQRLDASLPLFHTRTLHDAYEENNFARNLTFRLIAGASVLCLLIAAVGLYGMLAFHVTQRTREIAIRCVLGAQRRDIVARVLTEGMAIGGVGVLLGTGLALAGSQVLASMLYGVAPRDPGVYFSAAAFLLTISALACLIPAFRAMNTEPTSALRYE
jgi:putative ABC transport system permease protein